MKVVVLLMMLVSHGVCGGVDAGVFVVVVVVVFVVDVVGSGGGGGV